MVKLQPEESLRLTGLSHIVSFSFFLPLLLAEKNEGDIFFMRQKMKSRDGHGLRSETCSSLSKTDRKNSSITSGQFGGSRRISLGIYRPSFKTISWRMGVV